MLRGPWKELNIFVSTPHSNYAWSVSSLQFPSISCNVFFVSDKDHRIHGRGIFTYTFTTKINDSWMGQYTMTMDPMNFCTRPKAVSVFQLLRSPHTNSAQNSSLHRSGGACRFDVPMVVLGDMRFVQRHTRRGVPPPKKRKTTWNLWLNSSPFLVSYSLNWFLQHMVSENKTPTWNS